MRERRQNERFALAYSVEWSNERDNDLALVDGSKSGIAVVSSRKSLQNAKFFIKIFLKRRMFLLEADTIYSRREDSGHYRIGARFFSIPEGFAEMFDLELEEIKSLYFEKKRKKEKLSFKDVSKEYLGTLSL